MTAAMTILAGLVITGLVGLGVYKYTGPRAEKRYCAVCRKTTSWHPDSGCDVCRWDANS